MTAISLTRPEAEAIENVNVRETVYAVRVTVEVWEDDEDGDRCIHAPDAVEIDYDDRAAAIAAAEQLIARLKSAV